MESPLSHTKHLLLVEDSIVDARAVRICLRTTGPESYDIAQVDTLEKAKAHLERFETDVVLLDLTLPDSSGLDTLTNLYVVAMEVPIVVLTGWDDEELARRCIAAGAQDYLCKANMTSHSLQRALGYALGRVRETQLQALRNMLQGCQALSSPQATVPITRELAGLGAIRDHNPAAFLELKALYGELLERYLDHLRVKKGKPRESMEILATRLGDLGATPRDLIDIHMAALDLASRDLKQSRIPAFASDGRLFALEMMGLLVEYYRLSFRRLFPERVHP